MSQETIDTLQERWDASNDTEVIRRALKIADAVTNPGNKVSVEIEGKTTSGSAMFI